MARESERSSLASTSAWMWSAWSEYSTTRKSSRRPAADEAELLLTDSLLHADRGTRSARLVRALRFFCAILDRHPSRQCHSPAAGSMGFHRAGDTGDPSCSLRSAGATRSGTPRGAQRGPRGAGGAKTARRATGPATCSRALRGPIEPASTPNAHPLTRSPPTPRPVIPSMQQLPPALGDAHAPPALLVRAHALAVRVAVDHEAVAPRREARRCLSRLRGIGTGRRERAWKTSGSAWECTRTRPHAERLDARRRPPTPQARSIRTGPERGS
jgi:hypothetical protein